MRDIKGHEGRYAITEDGRVWSCPKPCSSRNGIWLKQTTTRANDGRKTVREYRMVQLYRNRKPEHILVHRLVAAAYIPNPDSKLFVNHKNGDSLNNHVDNLEWVTTKENLDHAFDIGLRRKPLTDAEIREIRKICCFYSLRRISMAYGMNPGFAWDIAKGRRYKEVI